MRSVPIDQTTDMLLAELRDRLASQPEYPNPNKHKGSWLLEVCRLHDEWELECRAIRLTLGVRLIEAALRMPTETPADAARVLQREPASTSEVQPHRPLSSGASPDEGSARILLLKVPEAAFRLGVSRAKLYELMASGELPAVKVGRARRLRAEDVERFVARLRH